MSISKKERIEWIDIIKGIGIVSVVYGHVFTGRITQFLYLFHMPLFFFIGGYLLKVSEDNRKFFYKRTLQLLVPYFTFLLIVYVPQETLLILSHKESIFKAILRPLIGGNMLFGWSAVFWFVTCFFLTQQLLNLLLAKFKTQIIIVFMFLSLAVCYVNQYLFPALWLPWNANVVFAALPIMYLGLLFRNFESQINYKAVVLSCALVLCYTLIESQNTMNMKVSQYGIPILSLGSAVILVVSLIFLLKRFSNSQILYFTFGIFV